MELPQDDEPEPEPVAAPTPDYSGMAPPAADGVPAGAPAGDTARLTPDRLTAVLEPWLEPLADGASARTSAPPHSSDAAVPLPDAARETGARGNGEPRSEAPGNERTARAVDPDMGHMGMHP